MHLGRVLRNPEGGEGGTTPPEKAEGQGGDRGADLVKASESLIARHGDAAAAVRVLLSENGGYRDQLRELKSRIPPDGSVVLQGEDAKAWGHYRELGKPAEIKAGLGEREEYRGKVEKFERRDFMAEVAKVSNYRASVLETLAARDGLAIEIVDSTEKGKDGRVITGSDGRPVRVAVVRGDGDSAVKLADYAADHWGEFLPSLVVADAKKPNGTPAVERQRIAPGQDQGSQRATKRRQPSGF